MRLSSLFILILVFQSEAFALECQWWQAKVKETVIPAHQRNGQAVAKHIRKEHCREKWKGADQNLKLFKDGTIKGWNEKEIFKKWNQREIKLLFETLSQLPAWVEFYNLNFYRAVKSIHFKNPATYENSTLSIIFYDHFFRQKNQKQIIVHAYAHHLYTNLSPGEIVTFFDLAGWRLEVKQDGKVYELPPKNLIKPDSSFSKDEDFSNHVEEFFINPAIYQKKYPKLHNFFQQRFMR